MVLDHLFVAMSKAFAIKYKQFSDEKGKKQDTKAKRMVYEPPRDKIQNPTVIDLSSDSENFQKINENQEPIIENASDDQIRWQENEADHLQD